MPRAVELPTATVFSEGNAGVFMLVFCNGLLYPTSQLLTY